MRAATWLAEVSVQRVLYFRELEVGGMFASCRNGRHYRKRDALSGELVFDTYGRDGEIRLFEAKELIYADEIGID
jgi:hypothetical protein